MTDPEVYEYLTDLAKVLPELDLPSNSEYLSALQIACKSYSNSSKLRKDYQFPGQITFDELGLA